MKKYSYKQYGDNYVLSISNHADLSDAIMDFCKDLNIEAGSITGIGALNQATLRFFNPQTKKYEDGVFTEQMELANLTGNISSMNGQPYVHLHCVLGRADYTALAGHLLSATINGACELLVTRFNGAIERYFDEETGLNMYKI